MGELLPTMDELKLLGALRRLKNRGTIKVIVNVWTIDIEPIGNVEHLKSTTLHSDHALDKKAVTA